MNDKLDDQTEIDIDNLLWDFQGYLNDPRVGMEAALDKSRAALRQRIRTLVVEAETKGYRRAQVLYEEPA